MKKLPCCISCAKSNILCYSCQERLESGDLSNLDLDISEVLLEIEESNPESRLAEASFFKSLDQGSLVIMVIGKGEKDIFKRFVKDLQREMKLPRIEFIEKSKKSGDMKTLINDFVQPGKLMGINKIFLPTGDIEYKARVVIKERYKFQVSKQNLEKLIHELTDNIVRLEVEIEP